jgi:hypothetical protein
MVQADPSQVEQVVMNLVINSRDAMPNGGTILIETSNVQLSEDYAAQHLDVKPGYYVQIAVTDSGCGMSEDNPVQGLRAVLHHQGERQGNGARFTHGLRHRQTERRGYLGLQRAGHGNGPSRSTSRGTSP